VSITATTYPQSALIAELFNGPIDIVGDVHGEIDPLRALLSQLGYDEAGRHNGKRRLVFVGDLVDRGPDSPAVLELVMKLAGNGSAQCILGNHEMNLLRNDRKHGNDWYTRPEVADPAQATCASEEQKQRFHQFLLTLPLALHNDRLRVVHACWHSESLARVAALEDDTDPLTAFELFDAETIAAHEANFELRAQAKSELDSLTAALSDHDAVPPFLPANAAIDTAWQMGNPIRVLTSGVETPTAAPFYAGGKWRMVERRKWWEDYGEERPVIIGHYWRRFGNASTGLAGKYGPDLFAGIEPRHWMGKRNNVYCVDFSVGAKSVARANNIDHSHFRLAAFRWPECSVMHDDGDSWEVAITDRQKPLSH